MRRRIRADADRPGLALALPCGIGRKRDNVRTIQEAAREVYGTAAFVS
jgi:hypothetical protein